LGAFCPEGEIDFNPLIDWAKYLVFINGEATLEIKRPENLEEIKHTFHLRN
jgi:hypothetical protein